MCVCVCVFGCVGTPVCRLYVHVCGVHVQCMHALYVCVHVDASTCEHVCVCVPASLMAFSRSVMLLWATGLSPWLSADDVTAGEASGPNTTPLSSLVLDPALCHICVCVCGGGGGGGGDGGWVLECMCAYTHVYMYVCVYIQLYMYMYCTHTFARHTCLPWLSVSLPPYLSRRPLPPPSSPLPSPLPPPHTTLTNTPSHWRLSWFLLGDGLLLLAGRFLPLLLFQRS